MIGERLHIVYGDGPTRKGHLVGLEARHHEREGKLAAIPQKHGLIDERRAGDQLLDGLGRYVLARRGHEQVLLPIGDPKIAVGVQLAYVAGPEPAVLAQHLTCLRRMPEVALHHLRAPYQDFAVGGDPDLGSRNGRADCAEPEVLRQIHIGNRRGLREPVPFEHDQPTGVEEPGDLLRQGRRSAEEETHPTAGPLVQLPEDETVGHAVGSLQ